MSRVTVDGRYGDADGSPAGRLAEGRIPGARGRRIGQIGVVSVRWGRLEGCVIFGSGASEFGGGSSLLIEPLDRRLRRGRNSGIGRESEGLRKGEIPLEAGDDLLGRLRGAPEFIDF